MDKTEQDKRIADLVAHKTPEEMARDLVAAQAAQQGPSEQPQPNPDEPKTEGQLKADTSPGEAPQPSPTPDPPRNTLPGVGAQSPDGGQVDANAKRDRDLGELLSNDQDTSDDDSHGKTGARKPKHR